MLTLVVARYNEDVSWVNLIPANVVIVNKAQIGNTGREASSWLWYIATHYHALHGDYLFCQADPFPHCPDFLEQVRGLAAQQHRPTSFGPRLTCDWTGAPHHPGLEMGKFVTAMNAQMASSDPRQHLIELPAEINFTAGAQFLRTGWELQQAFIDECVVEEYLAIANTHPQAPWVFERLWDYLIPSQTKP